jgi:hypothetical protein
MAVSEGEHQLKWNQTYLNWRGTLTGNIIWRSNKIIVPVIKIDEKQVKVQSIKPTKDWKISTEKNYIASEDQIESLHIFIKILQVL